MIRGVSEHRRALRTTFDAAADQYQTARPDYPTELFDDLLSVTGLQPPARLLEIGCGPGKATVPMAERGFAITAVELGPDLAHAARANLARFPDVDVINADFERWPPPPDRSFDLAYA